MKIAFRLLFLFVLLIGPVTYGASLSETREQMDEVSSTIKEQLIQMRTQGTANNTNDLVDVGIHNLRIYKSKLMGLCDQLQAELTTGLDPSARDRSSLVDVHNQCRQYALQQSIVMQELIRATMMEDMYLKKNTLYEERLMSFNAHLRSILEQVIFVQGTLTKVQKSITKLAPDTFTR